jgi:N-acetylmuramoyl-L-alanine amidase
MPRLFQPDSRLVSEVCPSPNFGARRGRKRPDMLILHYTGMKGADAALRRLCEKSSQVSSHYLVFEDGRIVQMVPEKKRAWHAGVSSWEGERDINSRSIGIEIANPGHDFGYPKFPRKQVKAVIALCKDIVTRHKIRADRVLAHSDVAPARKQDPGEKFPWAELHIKGVGHWQKPAPISGKGGFKHGDRGKKIRAAQQMLRSYGYGISPTGIFDKEIEEVVAAFQRHFRPNRVDGVLDASTHSTLEKILRTRPRRAV